MNEVLPEQIIWPIITIIATITAVASGIVGMVNSRRRNPPLAEELAKIYATKTELKDVRARFDKCRDDHADQSCNANKTINAQFADIQRTLGQMATRSELKDVFDRTDKFRDDSTSQFGQTNKTINSMFLDIQSRLGKIEGQMSKGKI